MCISSYRSGFDDKRSLSVRHELRKDLGEVLGDGLEGAVDGLILLHIQVSNQILDGNTAGVELCR